MTVINTNISARFTQQALHVAGRGVVAATEQLSTGLRVNKASDDAAGLAIGAHMTGQILGLAQATRNANDAITLIQTADSAIASMTYMLQRMRELSIQAASDTNGSEDRGYLDLEFQELRSELARVADMTEWNGFKILDGTAGDPISPPTLQRVVSQTRFDEVSPLHAGDLMINGVVVPASNADDDLLSPSEDAAGSAIAKAAAINKISSQTGVTAVVNPTLVSGVPMDTGGSIQGYVWVNGYSSARIETTLNNSADTRRKVALAINAVAAQTGVKAIDTGSDALGIQLHATDGRNIEVRFESDSSHERFGDFTGLREGIQSGTIGLEARKTHPIEIQTSPTGDISRSGFSVGQFGENKVSLVSSQRENVPPATPQISVIRLLGDESITGQYEININGQPVEIGAITGRHALRASIVTALDSEFGSTGFAIEFGDRHDEIKISGPRGEPFSISATASGSGAAELEVQTIQQATTTAEVGLATGELLINGRLISASLSSDDDVSYAAPSMELRAASAISLSEAINRHTSETGVSAKPIGPTLTGANTRTSALSSGTYSLYVNGVQVSIELVENEQISERLARVTSLINRQYGQHGTQAEVNGQGISLKTDGRNLSVWFDSRVEGLSAESFGLGQTGAVAQVATVSLSDPQQLPTYELGDSDGDGIDDYIEFSGLGLSTETLSIPNDGAASIVNGQLSFVNGSLYRGNGRRAECIGSVDPSLDGLAGTPLRINFENMVDGHSIRKFNSTGHYYEVINMPSGQSISWTDAKDQASAMPLLFGLEPYLATVTSSEESQYLISQLGNMESWIGGTDSALEGEWRWATGPESGELFYREQDSNIYGYSNWGSGEPNNGLGQFEEDYVYYNPSFIPNPQGIWNDFPDDGNPGWDGGIQSYIVEYGGIGQETPPSLSSLEIADLFSRVSYSNSAAGSNTVSIKINDETISSAPIGSTSATALASALETEINLKIANGGLTNILVERSGGTLTITSSLAGVPFEIGDLRFSSEFGAEGGISVLTENNYGGGGVAAVSDPTSNPLGVNTLLGSIELYTVEFLHADQNDPRYLDLKYVNAGGQSDGIGRLGLAEGVYGGNANESLQEGQGGRFRFQVGTSLGQIISLDLPDLSISGAALKPILTDRVDIKLSSNTDIVLDTLDETMNVLNAHRANLGAVVNRLDHAISNLGNSRLNQESSRSQILDADYAKASSELAKSQVMANAATAVLAQANFSKQSVLELLKFE